MNALVVLEICYLFHIRMLHGSSFTWDAVRGTRVVWLVVGLATAAQFAVTYLPPLQRVFGTAAVPLAEGLLIVALGAVFLVLIETEKQMRLALGLRA
jgi:magnesium-transporting ATPase (P-type)